MFVRMCDTFGVLFCELTRSTVVGGVLFSTRTDIVTDTGVIDSIGDTRPVITRVTGARICKQANAM